MHLLDLVRIDVEAGDQDHVLHPVDDLHLPVGQHHRHVAGAEVAVRRHDLRGLVRPLPVAGHDLRTLHAQLAPLAERQDRAVGGAHETSVDGSG